MATKTRKYNGAVRQNDNPIRSFAKLLIKHVRVHHMISCTWIDRSCAWYDFVCMKWFVMHQIVVAREADDFFCVIGTGMTFAVSIDNRETRSPNKHNMPMENQHKLEHKMNNPDCMTTIASSAFRSPYKKPISVFLKIKLPQRRFHVNSLVSCKRNGFTYMIRYCSSDMISFAWNDSGNRNRTVPFSWNSE